MNVRNTPFVVLLLIHATTVAAVLPLASPNGHLQLSFDVGAGNRIAYSFRADGRELIGPSGLGVEGVGEPVFAGSSRRSVDTVWRPVWGKRAVVPEVFNELTMDLTSYRLVARAYDDGVAFRYEIPQGQATAELTQFNFAGDYTAWFFNGEHPNLGPDRLSAVDGRRLPVMTIQVDDSCYMAVHEADLESGDPLVLQSKQGDTSFSVASRPASAWRVILYGRKPGTLVDSHLLELLNPPPAAGASFDWVKPGLAVWDWRINGAQVDGFKYEMSLPSWKRMVDFAAATGIRYLVLDADWYGPEFGKDSDPTQGGKVAAVRKLIAYAGAKEIGIWLYLNDVGGREFPIAQTLRQYGDWGAAGLKYGFMKDSPAEKNARTRLITELCARNHLLCDFHDAPVHPYGQLRTWPNAVTREYCHAQLDAHRVFQPKTFVTAVFVNMLAGPLDMGNGLADLTQAGRVDEPSPVPSTLTGEMARTLIVFSGVTIVPDIPEHYRKHPELLRFLSAEKMPWRESRTLAGAIGEFIVMARQASDGAWLVGAATDENSRELDIPLDFLDAGRYQTLVIQDGEDSDYRTQRESYTAERRQVARTDKIHVKLAPGGGACLLLDPR